MFASQLVCTLDEPIVIIRHGRDMDETLHEMLDQLDEEAERRHADHVPAEFIADFVGHEADFLPLHELALSLLGAALSLGGVPCDVREILA